MGSDTLDFVDMVALISNSTPTSTLSGGIHADAAGAPGALLAAFIPVPIAENLATTEVSRRR